MFTHNLLFFTTIYMYVDEMQNTSSHLQTLTQIKDMNYLISKIQLYTTLISNNKPINAQFTLFALAIQELSHQHNHKDICAYILIFQELMVEFLTHQYLEFVIR